jgi:hypothetical protein
MGPLYVDMNGGTPILDDSAGTPLLGAAIK